MKKTTLLAGVLLMGLFAATPVKAQLSKNKDKFLGNITTRGQVNGGGYEFKSKWNQLTCENETKWSSVQGGGPNSWNWGGADNAYNYCKNNGLLFKFHCLAWGSQYPGWIENLTPEERYKAVVNWMDAVKKRYPDIKMFDVVNEAVQGHQAGTHWFEECLGGKGVSGWDWIINAFELAHERWPDAILIYNDFNTFQWQRQQFKDLVTALRDYGAPIDAYGCQSHDLTGYSLNSFKQAMDEIQNQLKMPMYSTEYDIGTDDDNQQLTNYKEQIPYMWEKDYFAGLTLWGSTWGATWTDHGNSGILNRDGKNRPAYDWLVEYMKTDKAINAKSPFPGMKKQVDLYIKPMAPKFSMGEPGKIDLRARMIDKTRKIERIDFYANNQLYCTLTEAPWVVEYTAGKQGKIDLKAVLVADDGQEYVRYGSVNVGAARSPYVAAAMPGTLQAENFDKGVEGSAFHDSDYTNTGNAGFRTDCGVDINSGNGNKVVSKTEDGEWMEYTVNVKEDGLYAYELTASSGVEGSVLSLSVNADDELLPLTEQITVPCIKLNSWTKYTTLYGRMLMPLEAGKHVLRLNVVKGGAYIDKIKFTKVNLTDEMKVNMEVTPEKAFEKDTVKIAATVEAPEEMMKSLSIYINNVLEKTLTEAPYEITYVPQEYGNYKIMSFATDNDGNVTEMVDFDLFVDKKRIPYADTLAVIPGIIQAENFDHMGEGFSFHDIDNVDEGKSGYRTDNGGVDIIKANGGYVVSNMVKGEWLDYSVEVKETAIYDVILTCSTNGELGQYGLTLIDEEGNQIELLKKQNIANFGGWDRYKTAKKTLTVLITPGKYVLRFNALAPLYLDKIEFAVNEEKTIATPVEEVVAQTSATYEVYTVGGVLMGQFRAGAADNLSAKVMEVAKQAGSYVVKNVKTGEAKTIISK